MANRGFGLYVHWPFCQSKCPYCDFNSHVSASIDQKRWQNAYMAEIERLGEETDGRILDSVYFGGGTPSLMDPSLVAAILDKVRATWRSSNDVEITLEANPTSVEIGRFTGFHDAGINRVSIGVQALIDDDLRRLGRMHSASEALRAIDIGNSIFNRVNFDLIYARQDQTIGAWQAELKTALSLGSSHLSLYQLTVEDGTVFQQRYARGQLPGLPAEDLAADMFELTQTLCNDAGIPSYEVSNHARPGQESRHNLIYWRGGDYVGLGPGAHGRLAISRQRVATEAIKLPAQWLEAVETVGNGEMPRSPLSGNDAAAEYLMMGLRLKEGIQLSYYAALAGKPLDLSRAEALAALCLVRLDQDTLSATDQGVLVLNAILRDLLAP
ncbi:MAG: coproporphyrinogen III oxidase [Pseudorhodobacter sp.]|nr:coproporphyrinogen III oxidase [Pseudorhodobacter sp.]